MKIFPPRPLSRAVLALLVIVVSVAMIAGGALAFTQAIFPRLPEGVRSIQSGRIAPTLAVRTLAGDDDRALIEQAMGEGQLETAYVTLIFSTALTDSERVSYYTLLGQKYLDAKNPERARFCFLQAMTVLLLSADPYDYQKASAYLQLGKNLVAAGDRTEAEKSFDYAYTLARYSPFIDMPQRKFLLETVTSEYTALGRAGKASEAERAIALTTPGVAAPTSPARLPLPALSLSDEVKAAISWRQRAASRLAHSIGTNGAATEARRALEDALKAEDELRLQFYSERLSAALPPDAKATVARSRVEWLTMKWRIAIRGFGLSLVPTWERQIRDIQNALRQAWEHYYLLRREAMISLPDPLDAAQGKLDVLHEELMVGRLGLYPDYSENRLISEIDRATKERINLREDGLYIAILSQGPRGLLVITTADLYGRPSAMAAGGLGMTFPTTRTAPVIYPTATPTPAVAQGRTATTPPAVGTPTATQTQPTSPVQTQAVPPTETRAVAQAFTPTPPPLPTLPPMPTATFTPPATPTPAYHYQVIYSSGPTLREQTGNDNFHIVGMVVDQNGILIPGLQQRISWCCPAGSAVRPRPTIDPDNGRFDFFVPRGQFRVEVIDGSNTTEPFYVNTDVPGLTGYVEWEVTFQRTSKGNAPYVSPTPTTTGSPTPTGTLVPPTPTVPLPGTIVRGIFFTPGWNFFGLPLVPASPYNAASLASAINSQTLVQGSGVSQVAYWDGSRIASYNGDIQLGVGYFLYFTGTTTVQWVMTGYPFSSAVSRNLTANGKTSIAVPFSYGAITDAISLANDVNAQGGDFIRLWRLKDGSGAWESYPEVGNFSVAPDRGYLLEVGTGITWIPGRPAATPTPTLTPTITPTPTPTIPDPFEPNNSFGAAAPIAPDVPVIAYISYPGDTDYYRFQVSSPSILYASLTNLPADYDLYVYGPSFAQVDASFNGGQTPEYITATLPTTGTYYLVVKPVGTNYDTNKPYKLLFTLQPLQSQAPMAGPPLAWWRPQERLLSPP